MKKNIFYSIVYEAIVAIYPLVLIPYLSNTLGKSGVGVYSYTYSIVGIFLLICQLGVNNCGTRAIAKTKDDKRVMSQTFWGIYTLQLLSGFLSTIIFVVVFVLIRNEYNRYYLLLLPFILGQSIRTSWFFQGLEKIKIILLRNILIRVVSFIIIFIFVRDDSDLPLYFIIMSASYLLGDLSVIPQVAKNLVRVPFDKKYLKMYFPQMLYMFVPLIALRGAYYIDEVMIGEFIDTDSVGIYENAYKIVNMPLQFYTALANVIMARIANLANKNNEEKIQYYITSSIDLTSGIVIPIIFGLASISSTLVPWYMGSEFLDSAKVLKVLPFTLIFLGLNNIIRTQYFIPKGQDKKYILTIIFGFICNICLNAVLIPFFSFIGAAIASVMSEGIVFVISLILVSKEMSIKKGFSNFPVYIICSLIMSVLVVLLGVINLDGRLITIIQILAGVVVYFAVLFVIQATIQKNRDITIYNILKKSILGIGKKFLNKKNE